MPKIVNTIEITKKEFGFYKTFRNAFPSPPQSILDEWFDNVTKANKVFFDISPNTITTMDDGLGMPLDTFIQDFVGLKDTQGISPNSTGVFGVGGSKGIPFLIGRPVSIGFKTPTGEYYKGVWEYDGDPTDGMFPLSEIHTARVRVYTITADEYNEEFTRECGFVPAFSFTVERLGKYAEGKGLNLDRILKNLSVKMMEMKSPPDVTVTDTNIKGKTNAYDLSPAYHSFIKEVDGKQIIAPSTLKALPFEKKEFIIGDDAVLQLKAYKKSNITTENDRINEKKIETERSGEVELRGMTPTGKETAPNKPIVLICNPDGRILHRYVIDDTIRSSNPELMNFMVFVFYMKTWKEQVPFNQIKPALMSGDVYNDFNQKILDWMQEDAQKERFTHGESKDEDKETEVLREEIVYGDDSQSNIIRGILSDIGDCKPKDLKNPDVVRCQATKRENRALDMKIELDIPIVLENKLGRIGQGELDQALGMSYMIEYPHHMILLCDEIGATMRDNASRVLKSQMETFPLAQAKSFIIMTKTALKTGDKRDTDYIVVYQHEDFA